MTMVGPIRSRLARSALIAAAVVVLAVGAPLSARAEVEGPRYDTFQASPFGVVGCAARTYFEPIACFAAEVEGDVVRLTVMGVDPLIDLSRPTRARTYIEEATLPLTALQQRGDLTFPRLVLSADLPRTGRVDVTIGSAYSLGHFTYGGGCLDYNLGVTYAVASDEARRRVGEAWVSGTIGGRVISDDPDDTCDGSYGAFWLGPSSGSWALSHAAVD